MAKTPEGYITKQSESNQAILNKLRFIVGTTELVEKMKWGIPTYCLENKNIVGIGGFKGYAGLWFFNGSFLDDKLNVLINAQEGKTKGMRQWRFQTLEEVDEDAIRKYILEAIKNQKEGKEVKPERKALVIPDKLKEALASDTQLSEQFELLSLTRKREFAEYITEAKREATQLSRLSKIIPMILEGIGLNDKYR